MLLKRTIFSCLTSLTGLISQPGMAQSPPATQHVWSENVVGSHIIYAGLDAWTIDASADEDTSDNMNALSRLQLANSYPVRQYRDTPAWMRFEGGLRVGTDTLLNLRFQLHQVQGNRVDEAAIDHAMHSVGFRVGVVDPRISWCRTYDVDSPWIRENNPFCTIKPIHFAKSSAPGVQLYAHHILGDYSLQGLVGSYHPTLLGFASDETPTTTTPEGMNTRFHRKVGAALSASNLKNGTEIRLGVMKGRFRAGADGDSPQTRTVDSSVVFAGLNWFVSRDWAFRATYFTYDGAYQRTKPDSTPLVRRNDSRDYKAVTYELNHQTSTRDVMAIAYSVYDFDIHGYMVPTQNPDSIQILSGYPRFQTRNLSMSWRRDWSKSLFTVLQYSKSRTRQSETIDGVSRFHKSHGEALGMRVGYRF